MVRETVVWQIIKSAGCALTQAEIVPVCSGCLTVEESTREHWREIICGGCGRKLMTQPGWRGVCSQRCEARVRRKYRRFKTVACDVCKDAFRTTRTDAKFCSDACRQAAYRDRVVKDRGKKGKALATSEFIATNLQ